MIGFVYSGAEVLTIVESILSNSFDILKILQLIAFISVRCCSLSQTSRTEEVPTHQVRSKHNMCK